MGAVPSKNIPDVVDRLTERYVSEREKNESFQSYIQRIGKRNVKAMLDDLTQVPTFEENTWYYQDWGDTRTFTMDDLGKGECAGEVVSVTIIEIAAAEREVFEAHVAFEEEDITSASQSAYKAILRAARALVKEHFYDVPEDADVVVSEFRSRFFDSALFSPQFANYLFTVHQEGIEGIDATRARRLIEEAQLFIEGAYTCYDKIATPVENAKV
jgi:sulfite reductase (ferredoxin)